MTHDELVQAGYNWLLKINCSFVLTELKTFSMECPDNLGWKGGFLLNAICSPKFTYYALLCGVFMKMAILKRT